MDQKKVVYMTEGKDASMISRFTEHLAEYGGTPEAVREVTRDISPAFIAGVGEHLSKASLTFDKFHVIKQLNGAVDEVRREEQRTEPGLKSTRYLWLKNSGRLMAAQAVNLAGFSKRNYKTARSYRMKLVF